MWFNRRIIYTAIAAIIAAGGWLFFSDFALTADQSGNIGVQFSVPGAPPGGGDIVPPVITGMTTTVNFTTATVGWVATDDSGGVACSFNWGLTPAYGGSISPDISGDNFSVNLSVLATGTPYYFIIACNDSNANETTATGTFTTLAPGFIKNLTILAQPEKRVPKTGGNLSLDVTLLLYNPATHQLVFSLGTTLNSAGSSTVHDTNIPTGNFEAILKGQSHLAKKIIGVNIDNSADATLDFTDAGNFYLLAGDVQGTGLKDNFVDILDISAVDVRFNGIDPEPDLNRDGIIDVLDMSAVLVNYNKAGDPIY